MTKMELIKALDGFNDNANVLVDVILYNLADTNIITYKRFNVSSLSNTENNPTILVQCPDDDIWDENNEEMEKNNG